jgi:predicted lipoprotein with Yx(FWY)xxD motif
MVPITSGQGHDRGRGWTGFTIGLTVAAFVGGSFFAAGASAQVARGKVPKPTTVVEVVARSSFPQILVTKTKRALYTGPACTGACLVVWPPLLMPRGKTVPAGVAGLGTVTTTSGRLQVTYNAMPLYTFDGDNKTSVNGNGVGGFAVARVP